MCAVATLYIGLFPGTTLYENYVRYPNEQTVLKNLQEAGVNIYVFIQRSAKYAHTACPSSMYNIYMQEQTCNGQGGVLYLYPLHMLSNKALHTRHTSEQALTTSYKFGGGKQDVWTSE